MMFKPKNRFDNYLDKTIKDIIKIERKISKAKSKGERHADLYRLFVLKSKWDSDVFRDCVEYLFAHFRVKGYEIHFSDESKPSFGWLTIRWK